MAGLLAGRKALITAAAGAGIGFATARRFWEEGAEVAINDANEKRLERAAEKFMEFAGTKPATFLGDVRNEADMKRMWDGAVDSLGYVDVFVNNAGLAMERNIVDLTDEDWSMVVDTSLTGTFRCLRLALRHMLPRRSGAIINLGSVLAWRAQAGQAPYAAAKAGVMALTRTAAIEAAEAGVRVNAVVPSLAMNPYLVKASSQETLDALVKVEAFGRPAEPVEVANVIVFLASDLASYITGESISVSSQHP